MQFSHLVDCPQFFEPLARWHHAEWGYLYPGDTVEARLGRMRAECASRDFPLALAGHEGDELIGSVMLCANDMETRMEYTPWLASVYVAPEHRRKGYGSRLVERAVEAARQAGFKRLYLFTPDQERFYARMGWATIERPVYHGAQVTVMALDMEAPATS